MEYYKVLIQKEDTIDGVAAAVKDTVADFGVWCQSMPFDVGMEVKEPVTRDWKDEDGEDSYVGMSVMIAAYDMTVKWVVKGAPGTCKEKAKTFLNYLSGRDGSGAKMKIWCEWTGIGRQHVRMKKVNDEAVLDRMANVEVVTFDTVMRVEDPVTEVVIDV